jgi:acetyltransferase-like isoleucine patch superfamily enzyme
MILRKNKCSVLNPNRFKFKKVGKDVYLHPMSEIKYKNKVELGNHIAIDLGFHMSVSGKFGDYIHIGPHVSIIGGQKSFIELEDLTSVAAGVKLICLGDEHLGEGIVGAMVPKEFQDRRIGGSLIIKRFAAIGANSVVLPGVVMGEGSVLGANSLLNQNALPWTVYVGSPARPVRKRESAKIIKYARQMGDKYVSRS